MAQPTDFTDEVNLLTDKLTTVDDFNMSYEDITTEIYDEANDRAQVLLDGEIVTQYVYSGFRFTPIFVDEGLLKESLDIMKDIEVNM